VRRLINHSTAKITPAGPQINADQKQDSDPTPYATVWETPQTKSTTDFAGAGRSIPTRFDRSHAARENSIHQHPATIMTARNAPCPCGSGKKFKQCHGSNSRPYAKPADPEKQTMQEIVSALKRGDLDAAQDSLSKWPVETQLAEMSYFTAVLAQLRGEVDSALRLYSQAISLQRSAAGSPTLDPTTLAVAGAIQMYETAAGNYPGCPQASDEGMFGEETTLEHLEAALRSWEQSPDSLHASEEIKLKHANAWYNLGCAALANFTADDRRLALFEKAIALDPNHLLARFNRPFAYNYSCSAGPQQIFEAHRDAANWLESRSTVQPRRLHSAKTGQRIRLAYLSSDFRQHSVAHFILPVLKHHDTGHFEVFIYHNHRREDELTRLAKQHAGHYRNVTQLSDAQLVETIRGDQIDILIDLNGLSGGHRLAVLAQGAAPLQMNWLGYPNTTGLSQIDFRIVDELADPPGQSEPYCTESLLRLPHPFLSFAPPGDLPPVARAPCLDNGFITFGSFNALPKLNPPLLECWAAVLRAVPDSRLLIKNLGMGYSRPREQLKKILAANGIAEERLMFVGKTRSQFEHLEVYGQADISLDSFPYHGTTTSCESLLMGVPVLSRIGQEHRSRVGVSLLTAVGLESLLANDRSSLVRIASSLAADTEKLQSLRTQLREKLLSSSLTDAATLTRKLETALARMWESAPRSSGAS